MNVTFSDKVKLPAEEFDLVQKATTILDDVLGPSSDRVKAEWDRTEDNLGRPVFVLRISDWTGSVAAYFTPEQLASSSFMRVRLHHVWGNLLQARVDKQLQELSKSEE